MNTFAVSFRLLRIRSIAFCCFSNGSFRFSAGLRHFFFDRFEFLHLASFLICFCFFWILLLFFSCCVWLPGFCQVRFLQLLFWSFEVLSFRLRCYQLPVMLFFHSCGYIRYCPFRFRNVFWNLIAAFSRMPSLWKIPHLWLVFLCVILCRHVFSFLFSFVLHKETI